MAEPELDAVTGLILPAELDTPAQVWFERYYGTVDATPLYLILLSEVWRWTDDAGLVRDLHEPAVRALEWIDRYGDLDGDGFVEYRSRSPREWSGPTTWTVPVCPSRASSTATSARSGP